MPSGNVEYLSREGPTPTDDLPFDLTRLNREEGLQVMEIHGGGRGGSDRLGGDLTRIAYLPSHDRERVLRTFIEANPQLTEHKTRRGLTQIFRSHDREWGEVASDVLAECYSNEEQRDLGGGSEAGATRDCPFCGEEVSKGGLPAHLTGECSDQT